MNNYKQFEGFLNCCKTQNIKNIHLAEPNLIINTDAGDFGSIVIEFESEMYFITSKETGALDADGYPIYEFCTQKITSLEDIKEEITAEDIYMTLSSEKNKLKFVTEMLDEHEFFTGMELIIDCYYLFLETDWNIIQFIADWNEEIKYCDYPHQFGECPEDEWKIGWGSHVVIFPEG